VELDGGQCNNCVARNLFNQGWEGVVFDDVYHNLAINLRKEPLDPDNVTALFAKYAVTSHFDHLTVNFSSQSWWRLLFVLAAGYRPRSIVASYNRNLPPWNALMVERHGTNLWEGDCYFGASVFAFHRLLESFEYSLIAQDSTAENLYAVLASETGGVKAMEYKEVLQGLPEGGHLCWKRHAACSGKRWAMIGEEVDMSGVRGWQVVAALLTPVVLDQAQEVREDGRVVQIFTRHAVATDKREEGAAGGGVRMDRDCA
jgi:hypothetical protein